MSHHVLAFRNVDVTPADPVASWPHEAVHTALERGYLPDWSLMAAEVRRHPYGRFATVLSEVLAYADGLAGAPVLEAVLDDARTAARGAVRADATDEARRLISSLGMTQAQVARSLGTSQPRVSSWVTGRTIPGPDSMRKLRSLAGGDEHPLTG